MLKSVKLCPFARVRIFSIAKTSQIVCISSRVGFRRIQNHFFQWEDRSNCPGLSIGMVLDASKAFFVHCKNQSNCMHFLWSWFWTHPKPFYFVLKSVKLYPYARVSLFFDCQIQSNSVDFIFSWFWMHPKPFFSVLNSVKLYAFSL